MDLEAIKDEIAGFHSGKKWILARSVAVGAAPAAEHLREWGAAGIMIVAGVEGVGDLPSADRIHYTGTSGDTVMESIRAYFDSVENPSSPLMTAVDDFDPDREAKVISTEFKRHSTLVDRPVYGARPAAWGALEDKTIVDQLWDDAGVRRAPSAVVPVVDAPVAAAELASELGTVWVADNREGWHGGGEYVRWVKSAADVDPAVEWLSERADAVRVMPFLDGIPCSIHGFATRDGVAVFLPLEMIILRHKETAEFAYAQAANYWDPPDVVREEMRTAARRVGALLRERMGYLGGFGIDGVCTRDGFLPTELNPRSSAGHNLQFRAANVPLDGIELMLIEGDLDINAQDLEDTIVSSVETKRSGGMLVPLGATRESAIAGIRFKDGRVVAVDPDNREKDGTMEIGPAAMGSIIVVKLEADRMPVGPSVAPRAIQVIDLARDLWGVEIPPLEAAPDLCSRSVDQ